VNNKVVQRQVLYLGEINDAQRASWAKTIEVIEDHKRRGETDGLFPSDRRPPELGLRSRSDPIWMLWNFIVQTVGRLLVGLPTVEFAGSRYVLDPRSSPSRKNTHWLNILKTLVCYRLISPAASGHCIGIGIGESAMGDCWAKISR